MNHDPISEGSPLVHGRTQSQAFCPISPEPCKFDYFKSAKTHAFPRASEFFTGDERMWVKVEEVLPDGFAGRLDTTPSDMPQLAPGAALFVPRDWAIDIDWAEGHEPPEYPPRRDYWERCMVDACVLEGRSRVDYLYREADDLHRPDDKHPDSGWRIRGTDAGIAEDERLGRSPSYVALGAVLNQDDRWLHLIDEPAGEHFQWWEEERKFVRLAD